MAKDVHNDKRRLSSNSEKKHSLIDPTLIILLFAFFTSIGYVAYELGYVAYELVVWLCNHSNILLY